MGVNATARSSRRASQPPFWRISQIDRAVGPPSPCWTPPKNTTKWVFQSKKTCKPPSLLAPIRANFQARSGRPASQPLFDAAGKYDEVGIPVETKTPKKLVGECSRWHVVPPGPGTAHYPRRPGPGGTFV